MKRICVNLTDEHVAELNKRAKDWGVPVAEQIRRALNLVLLGYEVAPKPAKYPAVLITKKASE